MAILSEILKKYNATEILFGSGMEECRLFCVPARKCPEIFEANPGDVNAMMKEMGVSRLIFVDRMGLVEEYISTNGEFCEYGGYPMEALQSRNPIHYGKILETAFPGRLRCSSKYL